MCGPSSAMKALNKTITSTANDMVSEAKTIFGDASSVFHTITGAAEKIIAGSPSQQGWSGAVSSAVNAQIINAAASSARNIKAATGSALAAIGGGNAVMPSGLEVATTLGANEAVEATKTQQLEQATIANYEQGNKNYWQAIGAEEKAPEMLTVANEANKNAVGALGTAQQSQSSIDSASNWWQPLVMKGIGAAASLATGGLSSVATGGSFMSGVGSSLGSISSTLAGQNGGKD